MILNDAEYKKAQEELYSLEERLKRLQESGSIGSKGFTKAGIRKKITFLHDELAVYEVNAEEKESAS
jgi:uncharacterized protein YxjI